MKTTKLLLVGLFISTLSFAQPDQWAVAIDPNEEATLLSAKKRHLMMRVTKEKTITVDGDIDEQWELVDPQPIEKYIHYMTKFENGSYSKRSLLDDGDNTRRVPGGPEDLSGSFRFLYDDEYFYILFDVTDDEVNDGYLNPGTNDMLELLEAPYPDSAKQLLGTNPYPPYLGDAGELNKKYCYWGYLGAFQIIFYLEADGKCRTDIREKSGTTVKINYEQRKADIKCAWKPKTGVNGYTAEVGISFLTTLADSANTPYKIPLLITDTTEIAFEAKILDNDLGKKQIEACWSNDNNNVWDAMLWCSKLLMVGWTVDNKIVTTEQVHFYPNPTSDIINFDKVMENIEIISLDGRTVMTSRNVSSMQVANLIPGLYLIKINGKMTGKFIKI